MINTTDFPNRLLGGIDEIINRAFEGINAVTEAIAPGIYRFEDDDHYKLRLDVPGFTRDEISISLNDSELTVKGELDRDDPFLSNFEKSFNLPEDINSEEIEAKLDLGVLDLSFKKQKQETPTSRTIEIS